MVLCAAFGCNSNSGLDKVSFFRFPKDKKLQKVWSSKLGRASFTNKHKIFSPTKHNRLCSLHFEEDQFTHSLEFLEKIGFKQRFLRKLKSDAVPTIFPANRSKLQQRLRRRQSTETQLEKRRKSQVKAHVRDFIQSDCAPTLSGTECRKKKACPSVSDLPENKPTAKPPRRILNPSKRKIFDAEDIDELVATPQPEFHDYLGPVQQLSAEEKLKKAKEHIEEREQLLDRLTKDKQRSTEQSGRKSSVLEEDRDPNEHPNKRRKREMPPSNKTDIVRVLAAGKDEMHSIPVSVASNLPTSVDEQSTQTTFSDDQAEARIMNTSHPTQNRLHVTNSTTKEKFKDKKEQPMKPIIDLHDAKMEISKVLSVLNLSKEKFESLIDWMKSFKFQEGKRGRFFLRDGDSRGLMIQYDTDKGAAQKQNQMKLNPGEIMPSLIRSVKQQDPADLQLNVGKVIHLVDKMSSPETGTKPKNLVVQQKQQQQMLLLMPVGNGAGMPMSATNTSNVTLIPLQTISSVSSLTTATVPCVVSAPTGSVSSCNIPMENTKKPEQEPSVRRGSLKRKPPSSSCKRLSFFASKGRNPFQEINPESVPKELRKPYKMGNIAENTEVCALKVEDLPIKIEPESLEEETSYPVPMHLYRSNNYGGEAEKTQVNLYSEESPTIEMEPVYFSDIKHETMEEVGPDSLYMSGDEVENTNVYSHNEGTPMIKIESVSFYDNQEERIDEVTPFSSDKARNEAENTKLVPLNEDIPMIKTEPVSFCDNEEEKMEEGNAYSSSKDHGDESNEYGHLKQVLKSDVLPQDLEDKQFEFVMVKSEPPDDY